MFEQTFRNIDDILHKDAGCTSELDYTEQSSWLLFLKYLDALEADKAMEAELEGKAYSFILSEPFRWGKWAAPKGADGKLDHNAAMTGDDLRDFVGTHLFPYLAGFKQRASGPNTIEYKIGEVFSEIKNKVQSGYNLRDVIDLVDELRYVAFAAEPVTRAERAAAAHAAAAAEFTDKQQAFIDFVLAQYVKQGVDELDGEKLAPLLQLKYRALNDAFDELGKPEQVRRVFVGFQRHLYAQTGGPTPSDASSLRSPQR